MRHVRSGCIPASPPWNTEQWLVCLVLGIALLVIAEIRKLVWKIPVDEVPKGEVAAQEV